MLKQQKEQLINLILVVIDNRLAIIEDKLKIGYEIDWFISQIKYIDSLQEQICKIEKEF